jgi:hypothetical protein
VKREGLIWLWISPFVAALAIFQWRTATNFDANELEMLGVSAALLRCGQGLLKIRQVRELLREMLDSFEANP